jgi:hypothetical protein
MGRRPRTCLACGGAFAGTLQALYCSRACRQRAYYQRHREQVYARVRRWQRARRPRATEVIQ